MNERTDKLPRWLRRGRDAFFLEGSKNDFIGKMILTKLSFEDGKILNGQSWWGGAPKVKKTHRSKQMECIFGEPQ